LFLKKLNKKINELLDELGNVKMDLIIGPTSSKTKKNKKYICNICFVLINVSRK